MNLKLPYLFINLALLCYCFYEFYLTKEFPTVLFAILCVTQIIFLVKNLIIQK